MGPTPDPIRWHNGMLVTPTSQQQLALRFENLIQALPGRYHPFFWGVSRVEYAVDDLKGGVLTVRALDAVMRNGLHVTIDDRAPVRLALEPGGGKKLVYLTMRRDDTDESRRFVPCGRDAADVPVGEDGVDIPFLRTRLELSADRATPPTSPDSGFPLCEVRCEGKSFYMTNFMPPTLQVDHDSPLGKQCAAIPGSLRTESSAVADRAQLNPLIGALPAFEVILAARPHPLALYIELCRLAGAVAVLRNNSVPPQFPPYVHDAARTAFDKVVRFVKGSEDDAAGEAVRRCAFEREGIWFRLPSDAGWTDALAPGSHLQMILAMETDAGDASAQRWADNCVIGTVGAVKKLLSRRVPGLPRRSVSPGTALPSRRGLHFFRLTPDEEAAKPGEDLMVLADLPAVKDLPAVQPSALHLYVVEPEREHGHG
jgi:predicted component of type VI protein secretion system